MNAVRHLEDFDDSDFDPFIADEAMFGHCPDPYGALAELRRQGPVHALNYRVFMGEPPDVSLRRLLQDRPGDPSPTLWAEVKALAMSWPVPPGE